MQQIQLASVLDDIDAAREELLKALAGLEEASVLARKRLSDGAPVGEVVQEVAGADVRRRVQKAWARLSEAMHLARVETVKQMVDGEGWTITEIARATHQARQVVSRLYNDSAGS